MNPETQEGREVLVKKPIPQREEDILEFWNKQNIFEKSLAKEAPKGEFVFYDGPPFATGLPHYGHILPTSIKDAIPRYRTMQGYHVPRRWGWDCHGLPVENLVEQELGFKTKRDIETFGIAKFNAVAKKKVMEYVSDWKQIIPRVGRWVDMEHDYKTMDASYTESVWWAFKDLHTKGLIYEGFKAMHLCPRCSTTLSNFEVAQGYKDIQDIAVTVKLPLVDDPSTSLLIWTTTTWTLPGNSAAAVNAGIKYVKVKTGNEYYIVAKDRVEAIFGTNAEVIEEMDGKALIGKKYLPPFEYFASTFHKHKTHVWKVYAAPYVTAESGTGVVHLAPAFGEEDLALAQKEKIPFVHHVTDEGKFIATVTDFAGLPVKPKGHHLDTDKKIVEYLKAKDLLFSEEIITHSYPHCWRCDTPLLNWAATSWFVKVQGIKGKLLKENASIHWVPEHIGTARFQNGLRDAPDWAISRSRFWGAPLPVWRNSKTKTLRVAGSIQELMAWVPRSGNRYFVMRHGESHNVTEHTLDSGNNAENHLTKKGKEDVRNTAKELQSKKIDLIVTSPVMRAQETAEIMRETLNLPQSAVMVDERLHERGYGTYDGKTREEWKQFFLSQTQFERIPEGVETLQSIWRRVAEFLFEIERRYPKKNILIVTHGSPAKRLLQIEQEIRTDASEKIANTLNPAEYREISFIPYPHNEGYRLDLHRPYIDEVVLDRTDGGEWKRVPEVFDCWFESGSMPFASNHYPFSKDHFDPKRMLGFASKRYPADFIAESLDQTRGWFYSLIVLGTALFGKTPYKNVITNGVVLAENGQKMSKRLKNYPDLMDTVNTYGADALRYYLLSSAIIRGGDLNFSIRGVEEISKKLLMRLDNVASFYELYADGTPRGATSTNILDRWILSRLSELVIQTTLGFETYQLDVALRPCMTFIDDLSTWYLRRSRGRVKEEGQKKEALQTLRFVLYTLSHVIAPSMPFFAEQIFLRTKEQSDPESVHLSAWPILPAPNTDLIRGMEQVRQIASQALELRERAGMKVRQPLAQLKAKTLPGDPNLQRLIAEEINVKEVVEDKNISEEVVLDLVITPALKEEGVLRDFMRVVQDLRKSQKLTITDRPTLVVASNTEGQAFVDRNRSVLIKETGLSDILIAQGGEETKDLPFPITLSFTLYV